MDQSYDGAGAIEGTMNSNKQIDNMRTMCQKQVSRAGTSNYISQYFWGRNFLSRLIPASGTQDIIWIHNEWLF